MTQKQLTSLEQIIQKDYANISGIVVCKDGETAYEHYRNGCTANSRWHIFSVTKSILSMLVGIAIDKGYIKSVHQNVLDFFPNYRIKRGEKTLPLITIFDLLTMSVPHKYKIPSFTYIRHFMSKDWVKFSLDLLGGKGEIGAFNYVPFAVADVLSGILTAATGQSVFDFASANLFSPLGISVTSCIRIHNAKEQMVFNKATDISGWVIDSKGINAGGWGLTLSAADMAKIGQLFLNNGVWLQKSIVSSHWLAESVTKHSRWDKFNLSYGYLWWIIDQKEGACAAMGDGGNVIYFNPRKKIVAAIASQFLPKANDRITLIKEQIEPIFEK
jgi:CubicO group peptidase (beta-lactamase class C family)